MEKRAMLQSKQNFGIFQSSMIPKITVIAVLVLSCFPVISLAQQSGQKTFASADEASKALVSAIKANDDPALLAIFGPDGKDIVASGDNVEDQESRANFVRRYDQMHRLVNEPDGTTTLYLGAENWPTPVPLVHKGNTWYFDTDSGVKEILYRRVGRNEMSTIHVVQQLVAAQKDYSSENQGQYAEKMASDEGQHNGLYWNVAAGAKESPIGPLVASACNEGYGRVAPGVLTPFHGYYFRILTDQGKNAPGGAKNYVVNGKMTGGFAFLAYPAEYRSSGVMTFIAGSDGVVFQRDLGKNTASVARSIKKFDPDSKWQKTEDAQEETASEQKTD
jgi:Protein of unknown function (DUF2950)